MSDSTATHDFRPTASWENLRLRAELAAAAAGVLRRPRIPGSGNADSLGRHGRRSAPRSVCHGHLASPACGRGAGGEGFVDNLSRTALTLTLSQRERGPCPRDWLQTSPEFAMKRLLAAGARPSIRSPASFARKSKARCTIRSSRWSNGIARATAAAGMQLTSDLCETMLPHSRPGRALSYAARAFQRHVGIRVRTRPTDSNDVGSRAVRQRRVRHGKPPESLAQDDRDGWLDLLLVERVQPHLGVQRPALLYDFPASQAALARIRPGRTAGGRAVRALRRRHRTGQRLPRTARCGRTAAPQCARANAQRPADGKPALPEESRLLAAMERACRRRWAWPGVRPAGDAGRRGRRASPRYIAFPWIGPDYERWSYI